MILASLLYFISRIPFLRTYPVYYDSFEYLKIAQEIDFNNFSQLISSSHQPIHSFYFITILLFKKILFFLPQNLLLTFVSFIFGYLTLIFFFLFVKEYLNKKAAIFTSFLLLTFPYFFVATTNILYEPELLFFQIASLYFATKMVKTDNLKSTLLSGLFFGLAQSIFIGNISILPVLFILILKYSQNYAGINNLRCRLYTARKFCLRAKFFLLVLAVATVTSISLDLIVLKTPLLILTKYQSHLFDLPSIKDGWFILMLRVVRNILLQTVAVFSFSGSLLLVIALFTILFKNKVQFLTWIVWFIPPFFLMQYWHAGLFGRLSLFLIFPVSMIFALVFRGRKLRFLIVFLIAFTTLNYALKQKDEPPLYRFFQMTKELEHQQKLAILTSDYNRFLYLENGIPTFSFYGKEENIPEAEQFIRQNFKEKRKLLIDSTGLRFPYYQFDGDFYHVLSLGKLGESQAKKALEKFDFKPFAQDTANKEIFFFEIEEADGEKKTLQTRIFYPEGLSKISKNKTYSLDPLAQFLYLILGKKDPEYWWYDFLTSPTK